MKTHSYTIVLLLLCLSCKKEYNYTPPYIKGQLATDKYFGKAIQDPYRNLENSKDTSISNWYKAQTKYADSFLKKIPKRASFIDKIYELENRTSEIVGGNRITENGIRFFLKQQEGEDNFKLYFKKPDSAETLLFDALDYKPNSSYSYYINYIKPSWNGEHIAVSLSHSGKEISEIILINTNTKKQLPELITNVWPRSFFGVNWLPDNSGFTYLHFPTTDINHPSFKKDTQAVLYTLGQDPKQLNYIFGNKTHPQFNISSNEYPGTTIKSASDKYITVYLAGVDNSWDCFYAKIEDIKNGRLDWKPFFKKAHKVRGNRGYFKGDNYIFMTSKTASNYTLAHTTVSHPDFDNPKIIFKPNKDEVINAFRVNKDAIYVSTTKFGIEAHLYKIEEGHTSELVLPKKSGAIRLSSKSVSTNDLWVSLSGWLNSNSRYKYDIKSNTFLEANLFTAASYPEFENIVLEDVLVPSHDGVEVPLTIIYNKAIKKNSSNPIFMYGYGAYGDIIEPDFSTLFLAYVAEGGILCIPHVRGGGEKGEAWHKAGFKTTKPNTWKDLIACAEYMIKENFTSKNNIAIYSSSAGGIMLGRAMTERPDLFAAVISEVGEMNPLRMESEAGASGSNYKEFGTIKDSIECMGLIEMDPYLHIKDYVDYPAVYLTVGMNDPRVMPWTSGKFAARLQNATKLKKPVLLYADFDAGHNGSNEEMKPYREWANVLSFALWQTGHPDYQIKK